MFAGGVVHSTIRGSANRRPSSYPSCCHSHSISRADPAKKPTVSRDGANGRTPSNGMRPKVGLNPHTPQYDAGRITEPSVCVPIANGTIPAATAAAEPAELPPGVWPGKRGLRVGAGSKEANAVVW